MPCLLQRFGISLLSQVEKSAETVTKRLPAIRLSGPNEISEANEEIPQLEC